MRVHTFLVMVCLCFSAFQVQAADPPPNPRDQITASPGAELWREVRQRDGQVAGTTQVKGVDSGILINTRGDQWARFRITELSNYGGLAIAAVFVVLVAFFMLRGRIRIEGGPSGRMVRRYTTFQRIAHWTLATVFLLLGLTGLILLLGRPLLIPVFGKEAFSVLASLSKEGHNLIGPLFLVSLIMMLVSFVSKNLYEKGDLTWLLRAGGAIGKGHLSVGFFNTGEKIWFWLLILIGLVVAASGLVLLFPSFGQGRMVMEISHVIHAIGALLLLCVSLGHMYMGSIGMEGAFEGMKSGYVDVNWADGHHDRWGQECHDKNLILSPEEYANLQGDGASANLATDQGK